MRFRSPLSPPSRADRSVLPAVLVAATGLMAALQLALTGDVELPPVGAVGGGARVVPLADPPVVPPLPAGGQLFDPARATGAAPAAGGADGAPPSPLNGAVIAGWVRRGATTYALVQRPGGGIGRLGIGGRIAGWRLTGLSDAGARLMRGTERLLVPFGTAAAAAAPAAGSAGSGAAQESGE